jgi:hypothetical protein
MAFVFNMFTGTFDIDNVGVEGPATTAQNSITRWNSTDGSLINDSLTVLQDSGAIEAQGFISRRKVFGTVTVNTDETWKAPYLYIQPGGAIMLQPGAELIVGG